MVFNPGIAMGGLMQGIQASGQQKMQEQQSQDASNMSKMRMDYLESQMQASKAAAIKARTKEVGTGFNERVYETKNTNNWDEVSNYVQQNQDLFGDGISIQSGGNGDYSQRVNQTLFRNMYKKDTGLDLPMDPMKAAEQVKNSARVMKDGQFDRWTTRETIGAGTGYGKYARDKDMEDRLAESIIGKNNRTGAGASKPDKFATYSELEDNDNRTPKQETEFRAREKDLGLTDINANRRIAGNPYKTVFENSFKTNSKIPEQSFNDMAIDQGLTKNTMPTTESGFLNDGMNSYSLMQETTNKIKDIVKSKEGTNSGLIEVKAGAVDNMQKDWKTKTREQKQQAINSVYADSLIGNAVAQYTKLLVGAPSDVEFDRIMKASIGGTRGEVNSDVLLSALSGTNSVLGDTMRDGIQRVSSRKYPQDKARYWNNYLDVKGDNDNSTPEAQGPFGEGQTVIEGAEAALKEQAGDAGSIASGLLPEWFNKISFKGLGDMLNINGDQDTGAYDSNGMRTLGGSDGNQSAQPTGLSPEGVGQLNEYSATVGEMDMSSLKNYASYLNANRDKMGEAEYFKHIRNVFQERKKRRKRNGGVK